MGVAPIVVGLNDLAGASTLLGSGDPDRPNSNLFWSSAVMFFNLFFSIFTREAQQKKRVEEIKLDSENKNINNTSMM